MAKDFSQLFSAARESASARLWSQAVELNRAATITLERETEEESVLRLVSPSAPTAQLITLWPDDEAWSCSCSSDDDPCIHVVAALIAQKAGAVRPAEDVSPHSAPAVPRYDFFCRNDVLHISRAIVEPGEGQTARPLTTSLVAHAGGVRSGRIQGAVLSATKEDFYLDELLSLAPEQAVKSEQLLDIIRLLLHATQVYFEGTHIRCSLETFRPTLVLTESADGYRLGTAFAGKGCVLCSNGAAVIENELRPFPALQNPHLWKLLSQARSESGLQYPKSAAALLFSSVIPTLKEHLDVEITCAAIPQVEEIEPKILIEHSQTDFGNSLLVTARIVYGEPPLAELVQGEYVLTQHVVEVVPVRQEEKERELQRKIRQEFNLSPGEPAIFSGAQAAQMAQRIRPYLASNAPEAPFEVSADFVPTLSVNDASFELRFSNPRNAEQSISAEKLLAAWDAGERYIRLTEGPWLEVPRAWLQEHAAAARELLAARSMTTSKAKPGLLWKLSLLCEELEVELPEKLQDLREKLLDTQIYENAANSEEFASAHVLLRQYQQQGVRWLHYIRSLGFGALLADDMGLGKTLQALCVAEGRTLIIAPTSVIYAWDEQLKTFFPETTSQLYYGRNRQLDTDCQIVITSYGLLRSDISTFSQEQWNTVILDEAQGIKNPGSQLAQCVHLLRADFRLALTGTPIENSVQDLWSIFHFINPGLLGSQREFQSHFAAPIAAGDLQAQAALHRRVKPFILRRLKTEVAKELPPKTTVTLHCDLSPAERDAYRSVAAATRLEVLSKLDGEQSVFSILESLLRLRQVCCYPALVPGVSCTESSKLDLLLECLQEGAAAGHRALVFSQWTSLLDVVQQRLRETSLSFLRLDGSTRNRQELIETFQAPDGPPVFLLSLKAGGAGLTLTAADEVYLLDPWWNPAVEQQAADRAHRIGQERPVLIRRLIAKDTIEEKIAQLQERKTALAAAITEGAQAGDLRVTKEDLLDLLEFES